MAITTSGNSRPSTPRRALAAAITPREAVADQNRPKRLPTPLDDAEFAAVAVDVALDRGRREGARVEERVHLRRCRLPQPCFAGAAGWMGFRRVDVGDADLSAAIQTVSPSTMQSIRLAWPQIVKRAETALPLGSAEVIATVDAARATLAAADSSSPIPRTNSTRPLITPPLSTAAQQAHHQCSDTPVSLLRRAEHAVAFGREECERVAVGAEHVMIEPRAPSCALGRRAFGDRQQR